MQVMMQTEKDTECTLTWGKWGFVAQAMCTSSPGPDEPGDGPIDMYMVAIDIHGDSDGGTDGIYGEIGTCWQGTLEEAARQAKRFSKLVLTSLHEEEGEDDWHEHEKAIDLGPIIDAACARLQRAMEFVSPRPAGTT